MVSLKSLIGDRCRLTCSDLNSFQLTESSGLVTKLALRSGAANEIREKKTKQPRQHERLAAGPALASSSSSLLMTCPLSSGISASVAGGGTLFLFRSF
uniref:Uncharacterized protein n=1 Tax=Romanomermis culicivorax TaxID=13658 RepID=A0A915JBS9_ROMCU